MTRSEKQAFIEAHLHHELRCLLGAATLWRIFIAEERGFEVIVAMDSAFVHARCLFEFFSGEKVKHDVSIAEFGPKPYRSPLYDKWEEPLNRHVLHISKGRGTPTNVQDEHHLNQQVEGFAIEVLRLWKRFEQDPAASESAALLQTSREQAIDHARNDAAGRLVPIFG